MAIFKQDIEMRYPFVKENRSLFPLVKMCQLFSISLWSNWAKLENVA